MGYTVVKACKQEKGWHCDRLTSVDGYFLTCNDILFYFVYVVLNMIQIYLCKVFSLLETKINYTEYFEKR